MAALVTVRQTAGPRISASGEGSRGLFFENQGVRKRAMMRSAVFGFLRELERLGIISSSNRWGERPMGGDGSAVFGVPSPVMSLGFRC